MRQIFIGRLVLISFLIGIIYVIIDFINSRSHNHHEHSHFHSDGTKQKIKVGNFNIFEYWSIGTYIFRTERGKQF